MLKLQMIMIAMVGILLISCSVAVLEGSLAAIVHPLHRLQWEVSV